MRDGDVARITIVSAVRTDTVTKDGLRHGAQGLAAVSGHALLLRDT